MVLDSALASKQYLPDVHVEEKEKITTGCYNLCLIHEKDFYKNPSGKQNDPHKVYSNCSVQHFVYENLYSKNNVLKEMTLRNVV